MANRGGGYALNDLLKRFESEGLFRPLGGPATVALLRDVLEYVAIEYGCCMGDALDGLWRTFRMCCRCNEHSPEMVENFCPACYAQYLDMHGLDAENDNLPD